MRKMIGLCLITFLFTAIRLPALEGIFEKPNSFLPDTISHKVLETLEQLEEVPGLTSEEFSLLRAGIIQFGESLFREGVLQVRGADKEIRPYFVTLQAVIEHILSIELGKRVKCLKGIIHTPMPATPLCTKGEISQDLVDPTLESDPMRIFTVKSRATILRDYLFKGGILYIVYPKEGLKRRTEEQQKIYQQELVNYPANLFDTPLKCDHIPADLIGATYFFQDHQGQTFVFAIKMTQANDPKEEGDFGLWFGPISHFAIRERLNAVFDYTQSETSAQLQISEVMQRSLG